LWWGPWIAENLAVKCCLTEILAEKSVFAEMKKNPDFLSKVFGTKTFL